MPRKKASNRTKQLTEWITNRYKGTGYIHAKAVTIAAYAEEKLKFRVSANTVCRILDKLGIRFIRSADDPPKKRNYTKTDLLATQVNHLEDRVRKMEEYMDENFGTAFR